MEFLLHSFPHHFFNSGRSESVPCAQLFRNLANGLPFPEQHQGEKAQFVNRVFFCVHTYPFMWFLFPASAPPNTTSARATTAAEAMFTVVFTTTTASKDEEWLGRLALAGKNILRNSRKA
jgi:hypothetical protein